MGAESWPPRPTVHEPLPLPVVVWEIPGATQVYSVTNIGVKRLEVDESSVSFYPLANTGGDGHLGCEYVTCDGVPFFRHGNDCPVTRWVTTVRIEEVPDTFEIPTCPNREDQQ